MSEEWATIFVVDTFSDGEYETPTMVADAEGTLEPEEWVRTHGVRNYPDAIYFFGRLDTDLWASELNETVSSEFNGEWTLDKSLEQCVHEAIGAASVCWENMSGTGIFQDHHAIAIAEQLLNRIKLEGVHS